jgi:hypothetical protein
MAVKNYFTILLCLLISGCASVERTPANKNDGAANEDKVIFYPCYARMDWSKEGLVIMGMHGNRLFSFDDKPIVAEKGKPVELRISFVNNFGSDIFLSMLNEPVYIAGYTHFDAQGVRLMQHGGKGVLMKAGTEPYELIAGTKVTGNKNGHMRDDSFKDCFVTLDAPPEEIVKSEVELNFRIHFTVRDTGERISVWPEKKIIIQYQPKNP